jgi:hypothetical protein
MSIAEELHEKTREYLLKRAELLDSYIASYLKETGLNVTEITLVEQKSEDGLRIEWHCERKKVLCDVDGCGNLAVIFVGDLHFCANCKSKLRSTY